MPSSFWSLLPHAVEGMLVINILVLTSKCFSVLVSYLIIWLGIELLTELISPLKQQNFNLTSILMTPGSLNITVFYSKGHFTIFPFILGVLKFYNKELHLQIYLIDRIISGCHSRPSWSRIHRDSPASDSWVFGLEVCTTLFSFLLQFSNLLHMQNYCHTDQLQFSFMIK